MAPSGLCRGRQDADELRLEPQDGRGWMPFVQSRSDHVGDETILVAFGRISSPFLVTRL